MGSFATLKVYEHESPWPLFFFIRAGGPEFRTDSDRSELFLANQKASERARHDKVSRRSRVFC